MNYLRVIYRILAPGGVWINCGPLLWHWENTDEISIEISLEEVKELAQKIGFVIEASLTTLLHLLLRPMPRWAQNANEKEQDERTINTSYVGDEQSLLSHVYKAAYWTATKPPN